MDDINGPYVDGTYGDGQYGETRPVHIYGMRNGFAYIAFVSDLTWVTKVPSTWITTN